MSPSAKHLLFTDLDGTLLDEGTGSHQAALPALRALRRERIPVIFCTSKTFAETRLVQERMGINAPFIVENGGAIYFRAGELEVGKLPVECRGEWRRIALGDPRPCLLWHLWNLRRRLGWSIRSFSEMSAECIAAESGLSVEDAERARQREFDEPFKIVGATQEQLDRLGSLVRGAGYTLTQGGRYLHLSRGTDKGRAVQLLRGLYQARLGPVSCVGIGDSPNDLPMLEAVDWPCLVMRPGGIHHPYILQRLPGVRTAPDAGPAGWNAAVLEFLTEREPVHA